MSEWNLSDKKVNPYSEGDYKAYLLVTDVKEFIRRLKIMLKDAFESHEITEEDLDELAGEKLIEMEKKLR